MVFTSQILTDIKKNFDCWKENRIYNKTHIIFLITS